MFPPPFELRLALALTLVASLAPQDQEPQPAAPPTSTARAGQASEEAAAVGLQELRAEPAKWLGRRVRFVLQFDAPRATWSPGMTRFGTDSWLAFSAWADEQFTWDPDEYADPMLHLFVRRGSALGGLLGVIDRYERFEAVARVREVFFGVPWIEVESLRPLFELVGEGAILHAARARDLMAKGQWGLALQQLERAGVGPIPEHARAELERLRADCERLRDGGADARVASR